MEKIKANIFTISPPHQLSILQLPAFSLPAFTKKNEKNYLKYICIYHFSVCKISTVIKYFSDLLTFPQLLSCSTTLTYMFLVYSFCTLFVPKEGPQKCSKKMKGTNVIFSCFLVYVLFLVMHCVLTSVYRTGHITHAS